MSGRSRLTQSFIDDNEDLESDIDELGSAVDNESGESENDVTGDEGEGESEENEGESEGENEESGDRINRKDYPIVEERLTNIEAGIADIPNDFNRLNDRMMSLLAPIAFGSGFWSNGLQWKNNKAAQESTKVQQYLQQPPDLEQKGEAGHTAWVNKGGYNCILIQDANQLSYLPQTHLVTSHVNTTMDIPHDKAKKLHKIHQLVDYNPKDGSLWVACDSFGSCIAVLAAIKAYSDNVVKSTSQAREMSKNWSQGAQNGRVLDNLNSYVQE